MLKIDELERWLHFEIDGKIENVRWNHIHFEKGNEKKPEGIYIYFENNGYCIWVVEKGRILERMYTTEEQEVLWVVLQNVTLSLLLDYATANTSEGTDFRRALFFKELEIYSLFGENFKQRKKREIEKILVDYPYKDK